MKISQVRNSTNYYCNKYIRVKFVDARSWKLLLRGVMITLIDHTHQLFTNPNFSFIQINTYLLLATGVRISEGPLYCFLLNHSVMKAEGCFVPAAVVAAAVGTCRKVRVHVVVQVDTSIKTGFSSYAVLECLDSGLSASQENRPFCMWTTNCTCTTIKMIYAKML